MTGWVAENSSLAVNVLVDLAPAQANLAEEDSKGAIRVLIVALVDRFVVKVVVTSADPDDHFQLKVGNAGLRLNSRKAQITRPSETCINVLI